MPCDLGRRASLRFGLVLLLAAAGAAPARSQQERGQSPAQAYPQNSIDRWNRMPPKERERELAKLPPARARLIRQRIWRYNHMPPEEQQALRERYESFNRLPPGKQQMVRDRLREFRQLPLARRPLVYREFEQLRRLPEARRRALMNGEPFRSQFSPQEQRIIRDLATDLLH